MGRVFVKKGDVIGLAGDLDGLAPAAWTQKGFVMRGVYQGMGTEVMVDAKETVSINVKATFISGMALIGDHYYCKMTWKWNVWDRAWELEGVHWQLEMKLVII